MGKEYFKSYYQQNKEKIKEQQKINYNKKKNKGNTIPIEVKKGRFLISFD